MHRKATKLLVAAAMLGLCVGPPSGYAAPVNQPVKDYNPNIALPPPVQIDLNYTVGQEKDGVKSVALDTAELNLAILDIMETHHISGVAACIVKDDMVVWSNSYGRADVFLNIPVDDTTVFLLASISKTFVATAIMQLWEDGLLGLDDDINDYLAFKVENPYYPDSIITPRMILAHTSSIAYRADLWLPLISWGMDSPIPLGEYLRNHLVPGGDYYLPWNYLDCVPGDSFEYSNVAYGLAGYLVECISGQSLEEYCQQNIFEPLGMYETSWFLSGLNIDNIAVPTAYEGGFYVQYGHFGFPVYPCGQLRTSSIQLARHLIAFMQNGQIDGNHILDPATVEMMRTIQYPGIPAWPGYVWGLGWMGIDAGDRYLWGHTGGIYGCATFMFNDPAENSGVIILTNTDANDGYGLLINVLFGFAADSDADGIIAGYDNCLDEYNPLQTDADGDGSGDSCDICPGFDDSIDSDGDGIPDGCDIMCGNANGDLLVNVGDAVFIINYIFREGLEPEPLCSGNANGDSLVNVGDAVHLINYIFRDGMPPQVQCCP